MSEFHFSLVDGTDAFVQLPEHEAITHVQAEQPQLRMETPPDSELISPLSAIAFGAIALGAGIGIVRRYKQRRLK